MVHEESFGQLCDVLHVKPLGVLLQVVFPEVHAILGAQVQPVVPVDATHGVSTCHRHTRNLSIDLLEALNQSGIMNIALSTMIEKETDVSKRESVGTLVLDMIDVL